MFVRSVQESGPDQHFFGSEVGRTCSVTGCILSVAYTGFPIRNRSRYLAEELPLRLLLGAVERDKIDRVSSQD